MTLTVCGKTINIVITDGKLLMGGNWTNHTKYELGTTTLWVASEGHVAVSITWVIKQVNHTVHGFTEAYVGVTVCNKSFFIIITTVSSVIT